MHTLKTNAFATWLAQTLAHALTRLRARMHTVRPEVSKGSQGLRYLSPNGNLKTLLANHQADLRDLDQRVREIGEW